MSALGETVDRIAAQAPWVRDWFCPGMVCVSIGERAFELKDGSVPANAVSLGCGGWQAGGRLEWVGLDLDVGHGAAEDAYASTDEAVAAANSLVDFVGGAGEVRRSKSGVGIHIRVRIEPVELGESVRKVAGYIAKWLAAACEIKRDPTVLGRQNLWFWNSQAKADGFKLERACEAGRKWRVPPAALKEPERPRALPVAPPSGHLSSVAPAKGDVSPADDYFARGNVRELIERHGWSFSHQDGARDYFFRPGSVSRTNHHASLTREGQIFVNFASSEARRFEPLKPFSPFAVFAALECGGDLRAAAKKLLTLGYGAKRQSSVPSDLARMDRAAEVAAEDFENAREKEEEAHPAGTSPRQLHPMPPADTHAVVGVDGAGGGAVGSATGESDGGDRSGCAGRVDSTCGPVAHLGGSGDGGAVLENPHWPGQPAPLGPPPTGDAERPDLTNFRWEERYVVDEKAVKGLSGEDEKKLIEFRVMAKRAKRETFVGDELRTFEDLIRKFGAKLQPVRVALNADEVRAQCTKALRGWPMLMADTWLFVDDQRPDGGVRLIEDASDFKSFIHDYFRPKFENGQDVDRVNYVSMETLYCSLLSGARNWGIVEKFPHQPPLKDHYYTWRPLVGYSADGSHLAEFLRFFDNIHDATSRAVFAGTALTMFWGGPYGQRPLFIHDANMQGSGKSSAAVEIGRLAGGLLMTKLTRKDEDELLTRLLSPLGMEIRGVLWDNVDTIFKSGLVAQLITADPTISGRRLREGEGRRPANLVCFASLNAARVDSDIARRCLFTYFVKPQISSGDVAKWRARLALFMEQHSAHIQADCMHVLGMPAPAVDWGKSIGETFALWAEQVLARALAHPKIRDAIMDHPELECVDAPSVMSVMQETSSRRNERNKDIEEAETFMDGLCERVVAWKRLLGNDTGVLPALADKDVFIRTSAPPKVEGQDRDGWAVRKADPDAAENMVDYWDDIFDNRLKANTVVDVLNAHILAGRMRGLRKGRHPKTRVRGFDLDFKVINAWLEQRRKAVAAIEQAENAKVADTADTADG